MDRFTRNYLVGLGLLAGGLLALWIASSWSPRVWELNDLLEADRQLGAYPYGFRVLSLEDGVAALSSPRSFEVPVVRFLAIIRPELARKPQDHPEVIAAQEDLVLHQKRARQLIEQQPDVKTTRWVLDRDWYAQQGVTP